MRRDSPKVMLDQYSYNPRKDYLLSVTHGDFDAFGVSPDSVLIIKPYLDPSEGDLVAIPDGTTIRVCRFKKAIHSPLVLGVIHSMFTMHPN